MKGIAGFYYVDVEESGIYECKAKGIFRKEGQKPLVGDLVEIEILDEAEKTGNMTRILPRKNELIRPAVANIDQALVIFALENPTPNLTLLDRFLVMMEQQNVPTAICFNKRDLAGEDYTDHLRSVYENCGYRVFTVSAAKEQGMQEVEAYLKGKTTVVAGPSGVGKSSITNRMQKEIQMETGEISKKLKKGKHTTRHSQMIPIDHETYLCDTPGFSSLYTTDMEKEELKNFFPEFHPYEGKCRFMIKLIVGTKGSGKTKAMIDQINDAVKTSKGNVVVVEKGMKLTYDIAPAARLIDLDEYKIAGGEMLYGFVAGLMASNYDITDLYIDGILKVLDHDINRLGVVLDEMAAIAGDSVKVTVTVSADEAALPHNVKKYL